MRLTNTTWAPQQCVNHVLHKRSQGPCHGHINTVLTRVLGLKVHIKMVYDSVEICVLGSCTWPLIFQKSQGESENKVLNLWFISCRYTIYTGHLLQSISAVVLSVHLMNEHSMQTGVCTDHCNYGALGESSFLCRFICHINKGISSTYRADGSRRSLRRLMNYDKVAPEGKSLLQYLLGCADTEFGGTKEEDGEKPVIVGDCDHPSFSSAVLSLVWDTVSVIPHCTCPWYFWLMSWYYIHLSY